MRSKILALLGVCCALLLSTQAAAAGLLPAALPAPAHGALAGPMPPSEESVYLPGVLRELEPDTGNRPPDVPANPAPSDGGAVLELAPTLAWTGGDPDGDAVTYDVYLDPGTSSPSTRVCAGVASPECQPGLLAADTTYSWQVFATDSKGATTDGPVWAFATSSVTCSEAIANGGFELDSGWQIPSTAYPAAYSIAVARSGMRSARIGIVEPASNVLSYSSVRQTVTIPANAASARVRFWLYAVSQAPGSVVAPSGLLGASPEAVAVADAQYVLVLNQSDQVIGQLLYQLRQDPRWVFYEYDLLAYAGKTVKLQFGVSNDGLDGVTGMFVDDVSVEACTVTGPGCYPALLAAPQAGAEPHGVAVNKPANRLYVGNHASDSLSVLNSATYATVATVPAGDGPNGVAFNAANGLIYVADRNSNSVTVLRASDNSFVKTIAVGLLPDGVAANPVTNRIYVANYGGGTVSIINGTTNTVAQTVVVGSEPAMIAVNPITNKAYVALHGAGRVAVIDGAGNASQVDIFSAGPYGIAVDTVRNLVYAVTIETFRIVVIDGATDSFLGWAEIRRSPGGEPVPLRQITVNPNAGSSGHVYVTTVAVDGGWNKVLMLPKGWPEYFAAPYALNLNNPQEGIAFDPVTARVFVTALGANSVAVYQDGSPACGPNFGPASAATVTVSVMGPDGAMQEVAVR